jgi:NAD(P)H dehydrogenase (quinone)
MLMVTGVNGNLGGLVAGHLKRLVGPSGFVAGSRNPDSPFARELAASGVEVRRCDFDDPASLPAAFAGVEAALIISTYADNSVRAGQNRNAIAAAKQAVVRRLAYTSFLNCSPQSLAEHSLEVHYPTEQALIGSGMAYTILRHALYADIMVNDLDETLATGVLRRAGGTARCAYIARADLGLSAATVLASPGHDNRIYNETMEATLSGVDIAAIMSRVFGKDVRYEAVAADAWPQYMSEHWGLPLNLAKSSLGTMKAIEAGQFDVCTHDYEAITGRPPMTMEAFLTGVRNRRAA